MMCGAKMLVGLKREPSPPASTYRSKTALRKAAKSGALTTMLNTARMHRSPLGSCGLVKQMTRSSQAGRAAHAGSKCISARIGATRACLC